MRVKAWVAAAVSILVSVPVFGASFSVVESKDFALWQSMLFRNDSDDTLFCALQSKVEGTFFRVNRYLNDGDTFVELFNPQWTKMEGAVTFSLEFRMPNSERIGLELKGTSWGDSYTYDVLETSTYSTILAAISAGSRMQVINTNGAVLLTYPLEGSAAAATAFKACVDG